jgi:hypothetical protein
MRNFINILVLSLVFSCFGGCVQPQTREAWTSTDSWFHPPSEWSRFREAKSLPNSDVSEVAPEYMVIAEQQLQIVACVEITADRARELTGREVPPRAGSSLFLVRGVYLNRGTGGFEVVPVGSELLVEHNCLGRSAVPMKRQALVVRLSQRPVTVYVSCSMAE